MIIDVITYNGEKDLFDIRHNILKDHVDQFIVVEFDKTFSGKDKEFSFDAEKYKDVKYYQYDVKVWEKYIKEAKNSRNTGYGKGAEHWVREFAQKESIKDTLTDLKEDDLVFVGDCDEIWNPERLELFKEIAENAPFKIQLMVYTYYLNQRSNERFFGTLISKYENIENEVLNHLRQPPLEGGVFAEGEGLGWHFTSLKDTLKKKLTDSYTNETYATDEVLDNLDKNIENNQDFLGREFKYEVDEKDWPQYLKDNKDKYKSLTK